MPRTKSANSSLDSTINAIVARAASQIAAAVRESMTGQVAGALETPAAAKPKRGRPRKAAARPAQKPGKRRRGVDTADLDRVLEVISKNPGLRTEQIYAKAGMRRASIKKALKKLRAAGAVKISGSKRAATYTTA